MGYDFSVSSFGALGYKVLDGGQYLVPISFCSQGWHRSPSDQFMKYQRCTVSGPWNCLVLCSVKSEGQAKVYVIDCFQDDFPVVKFKGGESMEGSLHVVDVLLMNRKAHVPSRND